MEKKETESRWELQPMNMFGGGGNYLLKPKDGSKDFCISYQPNAQMGGMFSGWGDADTETGETAICDYRSGSSNYRILNGDWREAYEAVIDSGIDACIEVYERNREEFGSS